MTKGQITKDSQFRYVDQYNGCEVVQLIDYLGNSNHLYFTDPAGVIPNKEMIFTSYVDVRLVEA